MEIDNVKREFKENPVGFIAAAGGVVVGVAALINAVSAAKGRRAYAKQVNYRIKNNK